MNTALPCTQYNTSLLINFSSFKVDAVGTQSLFADGEGLGQIKGKKEVISPTCSYPRWVPTCYECD